MKILIALLLVAACLAPQAVLGCDPGCKPPPCPPPPIPPTSNTNWQICGDPLTVDLIAGKCIDAGDVVVGNDANYIYVMYMTQNGWLLTETHLAVGASLADIPRTRTGNPIPGKFAYGGWHRNLTIVAYAIPLSSLPADQCVLIAAHAVVKKGNKWCYSGSETAWGKGTRFTRCNWAMYFKFCPNPCGPPDG